MLMTFLMLPSHLKSLGRLLVSTLWLIKLHILNYYDFKIQGRVGGVVHFVPYAKRIPHCLLLLVKENSWLLSIFWRNIVACDSSYALWIATSYHTLKSHCIFAMGCSPINIQQWHISNFHITFLIMELSWKAFWLASRVFIHYPQV